MLVPGVCIIKPTAFLGSNIKTFQFMVTIKKRKKKTITYMYEYISYPILTLYNEHFEQNFKGFTFRGFWDPDPHSRRGGVCPPPPRNFWEIKGKKRENGKKCNIVTYFSSLGNFITKGGRLKPDF